MKPHFLAAAAAGLALAGCATQGGDKTADAKPAYTPPAVIQANASIPFVSFGGIEDWEALPDGSLLIEGRSHRWYRATFFGNCSDVKFADTIGFKTKPPTQLDRYSSILVNGRECSFRSLDEVAPPPKKTPPEAAPPT